MKVALFATSFLASGGFIFKMFAAFSVHGLMGETDRRGYMLFFGSSGKRVSGSM
jgi:hypothetical protein